MNLYDWIRDVEDFPKPGINFKDITPLLEHGPALKEALRLMIEDARGLGVDKVAGIESRGFIFGAPIANELGVGFVPIRKLGKLPYHTNQVEYALEYGTATVEMHVDAVQKGEKVLIVDDLMATGGTMAAACKLIEAAGGTVSSCNVLVDLAFLGGHKSLGGKRFHTILSYD
ncbi:MAG: adenine phosphoribosyltransferase [Planctomycetota bacterium]